MKESWASIAGYEGLYEVSDRGNVRSLQRFAPNRSGLRPIRDRLLVGNLDGRGYLIVGLSRLGVRRMFTVQRLVMNAFVGPRPHGYQINHKNGIKRDNRLDNLEYVTPSENSLHAHRTGLSVSIKGSRHYRAKLNESQVLRIRDMVGSGSSTPTLVAEMFGVSTTTIYSIVSRANWRHI